MKRAALGLALVAAAGASQAADWSATSVAYRTGSRFAEPFNTKDIRKDISS